MKNSDKDWWLRTAEKFVYPGLIEDQCLLDKTGLGTFTQEESTWIEYIAHELDPNLIRDDYIARTHQYELIQSLSTILGVPVWVIEVQNYCIKNCDIDVLALVSSLPVIKDWKPVRHKFLARLLLELVFPVADQAQTVVNKAIKLHIVQSEDQKLWLDISKEAHEIASNLGNPGYLDDFTWHSGIGYFAAKSAFFSAGINEGTVHDLEFSAMQLNPDRSLKINFDLLGYDVLTAVECSAESVFFYTDEKLPRSTYRDVEAMSELSLSYTGFKISEIFVSTLIESEQELKSGRIA